MSNGNSTRSHSTRSLKEKRLGTCGNQCLIGSQLPFSQVTGTCGNVWERVGTCEHLTKPEGGTE